jgi:CheY-specific phosphatase CheX
MLANSEILLDAFRKAVGDLVECYGGVKPQTKLTENSTEKHDFTAIIGMCDEALSASIALTTNADTVRGMSRIPLSNLVDWLGELSNQLAGRYKNKLAIYGLQPRLSTPTTVTGQLLQLGALAGEVYVFSVQWPGGSFEAQLSLELENGLELREDPALASAEEGSLNLF